MISLITGSKTAYYLAFSNNHCKLAKPKMLRLASGSRSKPAAVQQVGISPKPLYCC
jgi:hypothetical protein